jgi:hypothetical protein
MIHPTSFIGGSYPDYHDDGHKSALGCAAGLPLLKGHKRDGVYNLQVATNKTRMTRDTSRPISRIIPAKRRAASLSAVSAHDSSDESTCTPITPPSDEDTYTPTAFPPVISHVHRYLQREKGQRKPYQRGGPSALERRCAESQLHPGDSVTLVDDREVS